MNHGDYVISEKFGIARFDEWHDSDFARLMSSTDNSYVGTVHYNDIRPLLRR